MTAFFTFVLGLLGGFAVHAISMNVSFKQRTIDNKIKVYDGIITHWVSMRNYIYAHCTFEQDLVLPAEVLTDFDQMYGRSQTLVAEVYLVCEDPELATGINQIGEKLYRTHWNALGQVKANEEMEAIKKDAMALVARMREDIKTSTRFNRDDFLYMISGLRKKRS